MTTSDVDRFLRDTEEEQGVPVLSEAKVFSLSDPERFVLVTEEDRILAIGAVAEHTHANGGSHFAVETAVRRSMQFPEFEKVVAAAAIDLVPTGPVSFWSMRPTLDGALEALGFAPRRTLVQLSVDLPVGDFAGGLRGLEPGEERALIDVNNAAFATHREASALTPEDFASLAAEPWFDRDGILVAEDETGMVGFCWTKLHPGSVGEIYRIAVHPRSQGHGLGRALVLAGFGHLSHERSATTGMLWVDDDNRAAMSLYESIGMRRVGRNREFERSG